MFDRCAGVLIPLFSLRSIGDFGRGEIGGLAPMADFALAMGHRLIQLLPINEVAPGETSPYSALSVFAIDPIYVSADGLPGLDAAAGASARAAGHPADQIALRAVKDELLERSWRAFKSNPEPRLRASFEGFTEANRGWLDDYALFRALKDDFSHSLWETWPDGLRDREPRALADAARRLADRIARLKYFQFVAHRQWDRMRTRLSEQGVMIGGDMAFSPCRESAEVWANQSMFDPARSVGAPPDEFSAIGQRWGLPMPNWRRMRADGFGLIRARVRHARKLYGVLRIDHVVGLFRTYCYPAGGGVEGGFDPSDEDAQREQGQEILAAIAAEAGPMQIIAEDLGVIPPFVRKSLASLGMPGYKIARWEKENTPAGERVACPANYPAVSLSTTGTHDTETLAEWWAQAPADERRAFAEGLRIADRIDSATAALSESALDAILESVYAAPARLAIAPVQDLFGWDDRINLPGAVIATNWSWRLPFDLERFAEDPARRRRIKKIRAITERTGRFRPL
jgi:4-alpha-glucanotransferase